MRTSIETGDMVVLAQSRTSGYKVWAPDWSDCESNAVFGPNVTAIVIQLTAEYALLEFVGNGHPRVGWVGCNVLDRIGL